MTFTTRKYEMAFTFYFVKRLSKFFFVIQSVMHIILLILDLKIIKILRKKYYENS